MRGMPLSPFTGRGGEGGVMPLAAAALAAFFLLAAPPARAQKPGDAPPALVVTAEITRGRVTPQAEFVGSVFYSEVSQTATEVAGLVERVAFEEGDRVKAGQVLCELGSDLLRKRRDAARASRAQVLAELDIARIEFTRRSRLFEKGSIAEQTYDENRFRVLALERRAEALAAEQERLELEIQKTRIRAPFDGIVIRRGVELGEWVDVGKTVAEIGRNGWIDVRVDVPERLLAHLGPQAAVRVRIGEEELEGRLQAVIPRADIATRTVPVKIRLPNRRDFIEGQSAAVRLPVDRPREDALLVPRDALLTGGGKTVLFVVEEGRARAVPVTVTAYLEGTAAVAGPNLAPGQKVVVKGNERLRDGQPVTPGP